MAQSRGSSTSQPAAHHTVYLVRGKGDRANFISIYAIALNGGHSPSIEDHAQQMHNEYGYTFRRCKPLVKTGDVLWAPQQLALEWSTGEDFITYPREDRGAVGQA